MTQPILINLHSNEYSQEFHYYPFAAKLGRCIGSCNILNDLSNILCVPNKTEDLNLSIFNMITERNESKTLTKHQRNIMQNVNVDLMEENVIQINGGIMINVYVSVKKVIMWKRLCLESRYMKMENI